MHCPTAFQYSTVSKRWRSFWAVTISSHCLTMACLSTVRSWTLPRMDRSFSSMASRDSFGMTDFSSGRMPAMSSQSFCGWTKWATARVVVRGTGCHCAGLAQAVHRNKRKTIRYLMRQDLPWC